MTIGQENRGDDPAMPLHIHGPEQSRVNPTLPDGGLPLAPGVHNFQVFRACRLRTDLSDGRGWTYNHHVDMACWKGRLYVAWESGEKDEDIWPAHEVYSTSTDGAQWSAPSDLFPQEIGTPLRMYFFHAPNGRMLALAGLRFDHEKTTERRKGPLVVREIHSDHTLGPVFTLRPLPTAVPDAPYPPLFSTAADNGFVAACGQLLSDRTFLEQQDYGNLFDDHGMPWHDPKHWTPGKNDPSLVDNFGKAMCFYHRKDGNLVGIGKRGWVTVSDDGGKHWSEPVIPPTLVTGTAKVWGQRTVDNRYALVYNPDKRQYFPLVVVSGEDGVTFRDMRVVHGEASPMRYAGAAKEFGPRYVRGISEWANDGTRADHCLWIAYSLNEEDIWVSRIPVPVGSGVFRWPDDDLSEAPVGPFVPHWNIYRPRWTSTGIVNVPGIRGKGLLLEDADPYDYACATRLFPPIATVHLSFSVFLAPSNHGSLEVELSASGDDNRPIWLAFGSDRKVRASDGAQTVVLGDYKVQKWTRFQIDADASRKRFRIAIDGKPVLTDAAFSSTATMLERVSFRTGEHRTRTDKPLTVSPATDVPQPPARYYLHDIHITP